MTTAQPPSEQEAVEPAAAADESRRPWAALIRWAFLAFVVAGAAYWVHRERDGVAEALARVSATSLAIAFAATAFGLWTGAPAWRMLLEGLGSHLSARHGSRIYFVGQLGKYIPGGVWTAAAHATLGRESAVPRLRAATATLMTVALTVVTAGLLGGGLMVTTPELVSMYWWVMPIIVSLAALLHPSVMAAAVRWAGMLLGRPVPVRRLTVRRLWAAASWLLVGHVVNGAGLYALAVSMGPRRPPLGFVIGLLALATSAGLIVVFAPAGAGVREAIVVVGLGAYLDVGAALLVVILARLLAIAADFGLAGIGAWWASSESGSPGRRLARRPSADPAGSFALPREGRGQKEVPDDGK